MPGGDAPARTARPGAERARGLSGRDFARVAELVHGVTGILLPPGKNTLMEGRLGRRLRATGLPDLGAYCDYLFSPEGRAAETVHVIDALTTNKTDFFREPEHFRTLETSVVPALVAASPGPRTLKFWSAASSTGAEAYTIAMVVSQTLLAHPGFRVHVLGTDISTEVLQTAAAGVYPEAMAAAIPPAFRRAYVTRSRDASRGLVRIAPALRTTVRFSWLNLMQERYEVDRDFDVIFCRNVLIYFDAPTQQQVVRRLCNHLSPGGTLILGHSEARASVGVAVRAVGKTVYQRA